MDNVQLEDEESSDAEWYEKSKEKKKGTAENVGRVLFMNK